MLEALYLEDSVDKRPVKRNPSQEFIEKICSLYNDVYDDREEDSAPGGEDWKPGSKALHESLVAFQKRLAEYGYKMSSAKIRKILISGGCWTTETSREIQKQYESIGSVKKVAEVLKVSEALVKMYLPYERTVYDLEDKSGNARRIQRWREKQGDERVR